MCAIDKFLLYSNSIFDIVMINDKSTHLFVELLVFYAHMLGSKKYVSIMLRYNLLADSPYTLGRVVDRGRDKPIELFAVHPRL
jgi:multisubunit Na+/H+ antiporter MnhF subunit